MPAVNIDSSSLYRDNVCSGGSRKLVPRKAMRRFVLFPFLLVAVTSAQAKTQTVTSLSAKPSSASLGQAVTLIVSMSPPGATGQITFYDGVAIPGSATLSNGTASFANSAIGYGKRSLTALYGGDSNYAISLSTVLVLNVTTKPGGALVPTTGANADAFELQPAALADLNHDSNLDLVATASKTGIVPVPLRFGFSWETATGHSSLPRRTCLALRAMA
jgi:hypothetical protein